jgi:hypothetical protein
LEFCTGVVHRAFLHHCSGSDFSEIYPAVQIEIEPAIGIRLRKVKSWVKGGMHFVDLQAALLGSNDPLLEQMLSTG